MYAMLEVGFAVIEIKRVQTNLWYGIAAGLQCPQGCTCYTLPLEQGWSSAHILPWASPQAGLLGSFPA